MSRAGSLFRKSGAMGVFKHWTGFDVSVVFAELPGSGGVTITAMDADPGEHEYDNEEMHRRSTRERHLRFDRNEIATKSPVVRDRFKQGDYLTITGELGEDGNAAIYVYQETLDERPATIECRFVEVKNIRGGVRG